MVGIMPKDIPFDTIVKAVNADEEAAVFVLTHFSGYIKSLSTRELKDDYGNRYYLIDEDMRAGLEAKLIYSIINNFEILPA